jgi:hypothetical protein
MSLSDEESAVVWLGCLIAVVRRFGLAAASPCLMRGTPRKKTPANHRHERHHRHTCENAAYLSLFLHDAHHDDDMTVPEHARN